MYYEIQRLDRLGFSKNKIAKHLGINWRTVKKYYAMDEGEFERFLLEKGKKAKILYPYKDFVRSRLEEFPETPAAQLFDWLKEVYPDLPDVCEKTVYNFVMAVRQEHNIPLEQSFRQYGPVDELPYGEQAQVDFGQYSLKCHNTRKKAYFFAMVLSRSRMKYVWFLDRPFTAKDVCRAHEDSFGYFGGTPRTIVYDQDRTMVVDENIGNIILTNDFRDYTKSKNFKRHFCRKADPESKGKVENVIGYVKKNFLYNRKYIDLETLNAQSLAWLERTGNNNIHNLTKKRPCDEFDIEKHYLSPHIPLKLSDKQTSTYSVRKTNQVNYRGNFYSLPMGTYTGQGAQVCIQKDKQQIEVYTLEGALLCCHRLSVEKGKAITNTDHRRDKSLSVAQMIEELAGYFSDREKAIIYFKKIQSLLPRYTRDHLQVVKKAVKTVPKDIADQTLDFCMVNQNYCGNDFESVAAVLWDTTSLSQTQTTEIKPLQTTSRNKVNEEPQVSDINDYEAIINN
jgi:transposase